MSSKKDDALLPAKFIYEPVKNAPGCRFANRNRNFQGIPGIERTSKGRFFVSFYGGMSGEESGNFVVLLKGESYDADFGEPYMVVETPTPECRVFDPCLWIDDTGRLLILIRAKNGIGQGFSNDKGHIYYLRPKKIYRQGNTNGEKTELQQNISFAAALFKILLPVLLLNYFYFGTVVACSFLYKFRFIFLPLQLY